MTFCLDWIDETRDLGANGRAKTRSASAVECQGLAEALGLLACDSLTFAYTLKPLGEGRYRLAGELRSSVVQACVVSLDPVAAMITEDVDVEFWPSHLAGNRPASGERSVLGETDPEPIGPMGRVETGRIALEVLSAALDPYPRTDGAEFNDIAETDDAATAASAHPFAALAKLKQGPARD